MQKKKKRKKEKEELMETWGDDSRENNLKNICEPCELAMALSLCLYSKSTTLGEYSVSITTLGIGISIK